MRTLRALLVRGLLVGASVALAGACTGGAGDEADDGEAAAESGTVAAAAYRAAYEATTEQYADALEAVVQHPVVLGHSGAGLLVPAVSRVLDARGMVWLAAYIPAPGRSLIAEAQQETAMFNPEWVGVDPTRDDAAAVYFLFHDCDWATVQWARTTGRVWYPEAVYTEPFPAGGFPDVPASVIVVPPVWLRGKVKRRMRAIDRALPDAIDLIVTNVEAGLGLQAALLAVADKMEGPIAVEFGRVVREVSLGRTGEEALLEMAARTGVADMQLFAHAIAQAERTGISIGRVLRSHARESRERRRQRRCERRSDASHECPQRIVQPRPPAGRTTGRQNAHQAATARTTDHQRPRQSPGRERRREPRGRQEPGTLAA